VDDDDEKLLADMKKQGYCYFSNTKNLSEEEAKAIADGYTPQKIEGDDVGTPGSAEGSGASAWNAAGTTVEERDYTSWATKYLKDLLPGVEPDGDGDSSISIKSVETCDGLANICVIKGQARPHVDLHLALDWEAQNDGKTHKGKLQVPEVTIEAVRDGSLEIQRSYKKALAGEQKEAVDKLLAALETVLLAKLADFLDDFNLKC